MLRILHGADGIPTFAAVELGVNHWLVGLVQYDGVGPLPFRIESEEFLQEKDYQFSLIRYYSWQFWVLGIAYERVSTENSPGNAS